MNFLIKQAITNALNNYKKMKNLFLSISLLSVLSINAQSSEFINCIIQNDCVNTDTVYQKLIQNGKFVLKDIYFTNNSKYIIDVSYQKIDTLVTCLKQNETIKVLIIAHTDSDGTEQYNMRVSDKRANVIMKALIDKGISPDRLKAEGCGESQPLVSENTPQDKAINRRIEIEIVDEFSD